MCAGKQHADMAAPGVADPIDWLGHATMVEDFESVNTSSPRTSPPQRSCDSEVREPSGGVRRFLSVRAGRVVTEKQMDSKSLEQKTEQPTSPKPKDDDHDGRWAGFERTQSRSSSQARDYDLP